LLTADAVRSDKARSTVLLNAVVADPGLDAQDVLRVGALIRLAAIYTQQGDLAGAKTAYEKTGTSEAQCTLVDSKPRFLGISASFPAEAKMWGFEGWASVQFDISADGKVVSPRAVISYPPFIFTKTASEAFKTARYEKSYRPDGGLACDSTTSRIRFVLDH
jgi:outer membrane biosynthesis protein TonB